MNELLRLLEVIQQEIRKKGKLDIRKDFTLVNSLASAVKIAHALKGTMVVELKKGVTATIRPITHSRIFVVLDGGMVQAVVTDRDERLGETVTVVDYDVDGAGESDGVEQIVQPDGETVSAFVSEFAIDPMGIEIL